MKALVRWLTSNWKCTKISTYTNFLGPFVFRYEMFVWNAVGIILDPNLLFVLIFGVFCPMIWYFLQIPQSHLLPMNLFLAFMIWILMCTLQPSKHCFHAEAVWFVCVLTNNSSCLIPSRLVHWLSCLWLCTVSRQKARRLSSIIHHLETHQLKGQHFVGSWVIYNLLKVSSNCNAKKHIEKV